MLNHFLVESNTTRKISKLDQLHGPLHYHNERSLKLNSSLPSPKICTDIFKEKGETMDEDANILFLFKRVKKSDLQ